MTRFDRLHVWQRAQDFAVEVEEVANLLRYDAADQLRRSSASVADNIAEGAARGSEGDFARFVGIAAGSCAEAESQLRRAQRFGCDAVRLIGEAQQIGWMLAALRQRLTAARGSG